MTILARPARGREVLEKAQRLLSQVKDADELRLLQAVVFPLANGMSTQATAQAIGRSPRWVTSARNEFVRNTGKFIAVRLRANKKVQHLADLCYEEIAKIHDTKGDFGLGAS